jgi:hypothetical protein
MDKSSLLIRNYVPGLYLLTVFFSVLLYDMKASRSKSMCSLGFGSKYASSSLIIIASPLENSTPEL